MRIPSFDPVRNAPSWFRSSIYDPDQQDAMISVSSLARGEAPSPRALSQADRAVCATPPEALAQAEAQIRGLASLQRMYRARFDWRSMGTRHDELRPVTAFDQRPGLARLYLFHSNGFLREAACEAITSLNGSAFILCALYARANDWVPQVRTAARKALERLLPTADHPTLIAALPTLMFRISEWERLDNKPELIRQLMCRTAVQAAVIDYLMTAQYGPVGRVFRTALANTFLDAKLLELGRGAASPQVRSIALETLLFQRARRRTGYTYEWVDKSFGHKRRVAKVEERRLSKARDAPALLRMMLADHASLMRKHAADYLIQFGREGLSLEEIRPLAADPNPGVAERVAFYLRREAQRIAEDA
jgi:hypothetical protein